MSVQGEERKEYEALQLQKSEEVNEVLESRHILDEEIKMIIYNAEMTGEKLYQPDSDRFLAKMVLANVTTYVEYSVAGEETYTVHTAYSHRAKFGEYSYERVVLLQV
mgnify:CR=1 FL=1